MIVHTTLADVLQNPDGISEQGALFLPFDQKWTAQTKVMIIEGLRYALPISAVQDIKSNLISRRQSRTWIFSSMRSSIITTMTHSSRWMFDCAPWG